MHELLDRACRRAERKRRKLRAPGGADFSNSAFRPVISERRSQSRSICCWCGRLPPTALKPEGSVRKSLYVTQSQNLLLSTLNSSCSGTLSLNSALGPPMVVHMSTSNKWLQRRPNDERFLQGVFQRHCDAIGRLQANGLLALHTIAEPPAIKFGCYWTDLGNLVLCHFKLIDEAERRRRYDRMLTHLRRLS